MCLGVKGEAIDDDYSRDAIATGRRLDLSRGKITSRRRLVVLWTYGALPEDKPTFRSDLTWLSFFGAFFFGSVAGAVGCGGFLFVVFLAAVFLVVFFAAGFLAGFVSASSAVTGASTTATPSAGFQPFLTFSSLHLQVQRLDLFLRVADRDVSRECRFAIRAEIGVVHHVGRILVAFVFLVCLQQHELADHRLSLGFFGKDFSPQDLRCRQV